MSNTTVQCANADCDRSCPRNNIKDHHKDRVFCKKHATQTCGFEDCFYEFSVPIRFHEDLFQALEINPEYIACNRCRTKTCPRCKKRETLSLVAGVDLEFPRPFELCDSCSLESSNRRSKMIRIECVVCDQVVKTPKESVGPLEKFVCGSCKHNPICSSCNKENYIGYLADRFANRVLNKTYQCVECIQSK